MSSAVLYPQQPAHSHLPHRSVYQHFNQQQYMDDSLLKKDDDASTIAGNDEEKGKDDEDDEEEASLTESSEITLASPQDEVDPNRVRLLNNNNDHNDNDPIVLFLQNEDNMDPSMQYQEGCIMQRYLDPPSLKTKPLKPATSLRNKVLHALRIRPSNTIVEAPNTPIPRRPYSEGSLPTLSYNAYSKLEQKIISLEEEEKDDDDDSDDDDDDDDDEAQTSEDETSTFCEQPVISTKKPPKSILKRRYGNPANIMAIPKTFYYHTSSNCSGHISLQDPRELKLRQKQQQQQQQERADQSTKRQSSLIDGGKRRKWLGRIKHSVINHHAASSSSSPSSFERKPTNGLEEDSRRVRFSKAVHVRETYSRMEYNREPDPFAVCAHLTPEGAMQIKAELNTFKWHEMQVHPCSRINTHFFPNCN